jgi:heme exporter protein C
VTATTAPAHTGSRTTKALGLSALAGVVLLLILGLIATGPDVEQGEAVRLIYVHVPVAIVMNIAFGLTALGSAMWLWKRSAWWDLVAASAAEVGVVFTALVLATGMVWGRPTWGVYWTWDARLTSSALLFLLYVGYLAVRRLPAEPEVRNKRSAYVALLAFVDVPIVYYSVDWWRSLHQPATLGLKPHIQGLQLFTLVFGMLVAVLVFAWLLIHRFRVGWLEEQVESHGLELAIAERRADATGAPEARSPEARRDAGLGAVTP